MKWLSNLFGRREASATEPYAEKLVPDEEYQFKFGTKPMLPKGLRDLKITELRRGLLVLEKFEIDLTVDQSYMDDTPEKIAMASRCLRWAESYHGLESAPQPPVRLHRDNVLITDAHYTDQRRPDQDILSWLDCFRWDSAHPFRSQQVTTDKPLEDGYFSCVRILTGDSEGEDMPPLKWTERTCTDNIVACLAAFVQEETERIEQRLGCEQFIRKCYEQIPSAELTHPVFALLDFPAFDMGMVTVTFSGSVWSNSELRFWSRPTYYHK
jgi:hypothetical protein